MLSIAVLGGWQKLQGQAARDPLAEGQLRRRCCCTSAALCDLLVQVLLVGVASAIGLGVLLLKCTDINIGERSDLCPGASAYSAEERAFENRSFLVLMLVPVLVVLLARAVAHCVAKTRPAARRRWIRCLALRTPVHAVHGWLQKFSWFAQLLFLVELYMLIGAVFSGYHVYVVAYLDSIVCTPTSTASSLCFKRDASWAVPCSVTAESSSSGYPSYAAELACDGMTSAVHPRRLEAVPRFTAGTSKRRSLQTGSTCSAHNDCPSGAYCDSTNHCYDCSYIYCSRCDAFDGTCCSTEVYTYPVPARR